MRINNIIEKVQEKMTQKSHPYLYGFTFLELVITIAMIVLLSGSVLKMHTSGINRAKFTQTKAEMSAIAAMLEQYYEKYGDYPRIESHNDLQGDILCSALQGKIDQYGNSINDHNFLTSEFQISSDGYLLDAFGNKYIYFYRSRTNPKVWERNSYILISLGMKTQTNSDQSPQKDSSVTINGDIIYENSSDIILTNVGFDK